MTATVHKFPRRSQIECSACGATREAACDCGVTYILAGTRAAKAVAKNPEKSNRAIADEIGVSDKTVAKARKSGADYSAPEKRTGKDGKNYPAKKPARPAAKPSGSPKVTAARQKNPRTDQINIFHSELMKFLTDFSERFRGWNESSPMIDDHGKKELMQALYLCSDGFSRLAHELDGR